MKKKYSENDRGRRPLRVGESIRQLLGSALSYGTIPEIGTSITVTEVQMSNDLRHANVFVYPLGGNGEKEEILALLQKKRSLFMDIISKGMKLKYLPNIKFLWDETFDYAEKIRSILEEDANIKTENSYRAE